jgi:hypothetical protein
MAFGLGLFLAMLMKPLIDEPEFWAGISWLGTIIAFVLALYLSATAVVFYGTGSSEGRFWLAVTFMMLVILAGILVSSFIGDATLSFQVYTAFNAVAFLVFMMATILKLKAAGVRPDAKSAIFSAFVVGMGLVLTVLFMTTLKDYESAAYTYGEFDYMQYPLNVFVSIVSFALIFLSAMMAYLMGGHISKGWYIISLAAILNALAYSFSSALSAIGAYEAGHYVDGISIMALNAVAYSAYYQYRKHKELMG